MSPSILFTKMMQSCKCFLHVSQMPTIEYDLLSTTCFWNNLHHGRSKSKAKWLKVSRSIKPKGLNRIAKICYAWGRRTLVLLMIALFRIRFIMFKLYIYYIYSSWRKSYHMSYMIYFGSRPFVIILPFTEIAYTMYIR